MNCGIPPCMNNTELLIVDGDLPGSNVTYICIEGHAATVDGVLKYVISTSCEIETDPSPVMSWAEVTSECDRKC